MKKIRLIIACLLLIVSASAFAQNVNVKGNVTDEKGEAVPFAAVMAKGTMNGTATDENGNYAINVPSNAVLVISSVGYKTQEVPVNGKAVVNVVLAGDAEFLNEVVVTAYGTSTKGSFTGSAAVVKSDKLEERQVSNVTQALAGQVAGVQIQSANGQPGVSATIRVRGVGSINAGKDPLIVLDGVPFDGDMSSINTQDIESVTVQKDAVSTALYGARGANGVVMITTKKGKSGDAVVKFEARLGQNSRAIRNYDVITSTDEYVEKAYQAIYNSAFYNIGAYKGDPVKANAYANAAIFSESGGGFGYRIYDFPGSTFIGMDGRIVDDATIGYSDGSNYYIPDDWAAATFNKKLRQEYNVSVSAANEKLNYYASFGFLDDKGIIDNSGFKRFTGRLKADYQVKKWMKVGGNLAYTNSNSAYPGEQTNSASSGNAFFIANYIAPVYPIYVRDASGEIMRNAVYDRPIYDYGDATMVAFGRTFMNIANPKGDLTYNKTEYLMDIMNFNWFAEISPVKGLTLTARYGLNIDNTRYNDLGNALYGQTASYGGTVVQEASRTYGFDQQYVANYKFTFAQKNNVDITAGYEAYKFQETYVEGTGQNLYNPDSYYLSNAIDQKNCYGAKKAYATKGLFGFINYNYDQRIFATFSYRRDGSSRFAPENRWGNFFSGSAAWVISNENFMKNVSWIDFLKLKASFGQQGNDAIGNYYAYLDQYRMTGAKGVFADGTLEYKGNPNLTWEKQISYNVGLEFNLLNNAINGSVEYYGRQANDMLYNKPTAPIAGYSSIPMNIGSMRNSGVEIDLNFKLFDKKNFSWDLYGNATFQKNKILSLHPDLEGELIDGSRVYTEGYSMYRMWLVKYAGVDSETGEALYWAKDDETGKEYKTSNFSLAQGNKAATEDLLPKVYGGFGTSLKFFGFDFGIQFSYQLGGKIYDSGYRSLMHGGSTSYAGQNWHTDIRNSWTPNNPYTDIPRVDASDNYTISTSDRWITSSNYLSINNISFGYTIPEKATKKIGISNIHIGVTADNVALFSARKGLDPRQSYTSATTAVYTSIRTVSGGLKITF